MRLRGSLTVTLCCLTLCAPAGARGESTPTPTPRPKPTRRLGGGAFGVPPAPTAVPKQGSDGSLADIVRKTQDQAPASGSKRSRGIVISNETLRKAEPTPSGSSISIVGKRGEKAVVKIPPTPTPAPSLPEYRDASGRTEAEWRIRASAIRSAADVADAKVTAAQAEVKRLENDFYAWSDGNYRERVIRPAWDQAKERLRSLEDEAAKAKAALTDLEEEARKSGTPPGWLR